MRWFYILSLLACLSTTYAQSIDDSIRYKTWEYLSMKDSITMIEGELEELKLRRVIRDIQSVGIPTEEYVQHSAMVLAYSSQFKVPLYVMHIITPDIAQGTQFRLDQFSPDPKVPGGTAVDEDYFLKELQSDSTYIYDDFGYDRGHMAPSTDFRWSQKALGESYYYSNIAPQRAEFNRKAWAEIESWLRAYVYRNELAQLIVFTAPVLVDGLPVIDRGINKVAIPREFVKVAIDLKNQRGFAVRMPNREITDAMENYIVSIDEVEELLHLNLFHLLPDSVQHRIESHTQARDWAPELVDGSVLPIDPKHLPQGHVNSLMARNYVQRRNQVSVCGTIVSARYSRSGNLWMNMDKRFPDQVFSIMIRKKDLIHFPYDVKSYLMGKTICCTGQVNDMNGTPTMTLSKSQSLSEFVRHKDK